MQYYKYVRKSDSVLIFKIHQAVQNCKPLAMAKYKSNWEDALDDAYFHILEHFDESQGSLEHYAMSVVSTIYLNKYSREIGSEIVFDIESDKTAVKKDEVANPYNNMSFEEEDIEYDKELKNCIQYLLPYFIKDYELFYSKDSSTRKLNYNGLFELFPIKVLVDAVEILSKGYYEEAKYLNILSKECHMRNFDADRYKNSLDKTLAYDGRIGDIVKCKAIGVKRKKYVYSLNIESLIDRIYKMFYDIQGIASKVICDNTVYCTLSGKLICGKDTLYEALEREIIGSVLAMRTNLKVLNYEKGVEIILTSTREDEPSIILTMFKTGVHIPLTRLIMGKVEK